MNMAIDGSVESAAIFAEHAAPLRFEDLGAAVVEHTKASILDTLAVTMAGSSTSDLAALHRIVSRWGGAPEATVVAFGDRVPPYAAVLLNCAMAHQFDFDDIHDAAACHPGSATVLPALATAESVGGIGGRELITAVAAAVDLTARLGLAIRGTLWDYSWVRPPIVGIFGAALAAGKVLNLDARRLHHALGLALPQAAGTRQCLEHEGSSVRGLRDGLIFKDGVLAAFMAAEGIRGDEGCFDGDYGLFQVYFRGEYDRERLLGGLGDRYEGVNVSLKPWPSCRNTHATLTALFDLMRRPGYDPAQLEEVEVRVGDSNKHITEPLGAEFRGRMDLLCNLPFAIGFAIAHGNLPTSAFSETSFRDPRVRAAVAKLRFVNDPAQNRHGTIEPGHVLMRFADGSRWEQTAEHALGHPDHPMSRDVLAEKARMAAADSRYPPSADAVERLIDAVFSAEDLRDVGVLAALTARTAETFPR